ncbi:MAG: Do family serine endopeptidase [Bacteroidetes bacterium]|nr:Do family serine endopeptidase [Bacteroidota bacterium]
MRKYLLFFGIALLGGVSALGLAKVFTKGEPSEFGAHQNFQFTSVAGDMPQANFINAAQIVTPAVVHVKVTGSSEASAEDGDTQGQFDPLEFFKKHGFELPQSGQSLKAGSGVILSEDGYIVTNNHVIEGGGSIEVVLNNKKSYKGTVIGTDPNFDIALIKIDPKEKLPFVSYGNSDDLKVGEWVLAVGNPFNLTSTVTAGIVSAKARNIRLINGSSPVEAFIQTDAAVNPGNSGGALVNTRGELVGINTAIASQTGNYEGYSFAVPVNIVKKVVDDLHKYGKVQRGYLGIQITDVDSKKAEENDLKEVKGVFVEKSNEGSAAMDAGLKKGDVILKVDDVEINSVSELQEQISRRKPGDKVVITYQRDNMIKTTDVVLKNEAGNTKITESASVETGRALGAEFASMDKNALLKLELKNGVKVTKVGPGKFKNAGIPEGFVITKVDKNEVSSVSEVTAAIVNKKGGVLVEGLNPDGTKGYYALGID